MVKSTTASNRKDLASFLSDGGFVNDNSRTTNLSGLEKKINFNFLNETPESQSYSFLEPGQFSPSYESQVGVVESLPDFSEFKKRLKENTTSDTDAFSRNWANYTIPQMEWLLDQPRDPNRQAESLGDVGNNIGRMFTDAAKGGIALFAGKTLLDTGINIVYGVTKPLAVVPATITAISSLYRDSYRRGDFDFQNWDQIKNSYSASVLFEDAKRIGSKWNSDVGTGIGRNSKWRSHFDYGGLFYEQNWGQTTDSRLDAWYMSGAELLRATNLPGLQNITASALLGGAYNLGLDPINYLTLGVGAGANLMTRATANGTLLRNNAVNDLIRRSVVDSVQKLPGNSAPTIAKINQTLDAVNPATGLSNIDQMTAQWVAVVNETGSSSAGVLNTAQETKRSLVSFLNRSEGFDETINKIFVNVDGQKVTVEVSDKLVNQVQNGIQSVAKQSRQGASAVSSAEKGDVGKLVNHLGLDEQMRTLAQFNARQASNVARGAPTPNEVWTPLSPNRNPGEFDTQLSFIYPGTGFAGRFVINKIVNSLKKIDLLVAKRAPSLSPYTNGFSQWDNISQPIGIKLLSANTPVSDMTIRFFPQQIRSALFTRNFEFGPGLTVSKAAPGTRRPIAKLFTGRGNQFKDTIASPLSTPNQVINAKASLRALARGSAKKKSAASVLSQRFREWQVDTDAAVRESLESQGNTSLLDLPPEAYQIEIGKILQRAVNGDADAVAIVGEVAVKLFKDFAGDNPEGLIGIAHRMSGQKFINEVDDWSHRALTPEAAEALNKNAAKKPRYKRRDPFPKAGFENKRKHVKPSEYEKNLAKFIKDKHQKTLRDLSVEERFKFEKEYSLESNATSSKFAGESFVEPGSPNYRGGTGDAPSVETQIQNIADDLDLDYALFDDNIFSSMAAYVNNLSNRVGDVFANTLLLDANVLISNDGWIISSSFPSAATATAARKIKVRVKQLESIESELSIKLARQQDAEGLELFWLTKEIENVVEMKGALNKEYEKTVEQYQVLQRDNVLKEEYYSALELDVADARVRLVAITREYEQLVESARLQGKDLTKSELNRVVKLQEQLNEVERRLLSLNIGKNVEAGFTDGLYVNYYNQAKDASSFNYWLNTQISSEFGNLEAGRRFFDWYSGEYQAQYKGLLDWVDGLPDDIDDPTILEEVWQGALNVFDNNEDIAEAFLSDLLRKAQQSGDESFLYPRDGFVDENIAFELNRRLASLSFVDPETNAVYPARQGMEFFDKLQDAVDVDSVGEWLFIQDMDRFLPGGMNDNYNGSIKGVFAALDLSDSLTQDALSKLQKIIDDADSLGVELPASLKSKKLPNKENYEEAVELVQSSLNMTNLSKKIDHAENVINSEAYAEAAAVIVAFENKAPLLNLDNIDDLRIAESAYAQALIERQMALQNQIGASPVGSMEFRIPNFFTSEGETLTLAQYVNLKNIDNQYKAALRDGSTPRSVSSQPLEIIEKTVAEGGDSVKLLEDATGSYDQIIEAYGLREMAFDALAQGREIDFYILPNGKIYQVEASVLRASDETFDSIVNENIADAVYRELGMPTRNSSIEYKYDSLKDEWYPVQILEFDPNSQFVALNSDNTFGGASYLDMEGQASFENSFALDQFEEATYVMYDVDSQIGQGSIFDLLMGNWGVADQGGLWVNNEGKIVRGFNRNSFGDDLPNFGEPGSQPVVKPAQVKPVDEFAFSNLSGPARRRALRRQKAEQARIDKLSPEERAELNRLADEQNVEATQNTVVPQEFVEMSDTGFTLETFIANGFKSADGSVGFHPGYSQALESYSATLAQNGVDPVTAVTQQVDQILALRSRYGGWRNFVTQHGGRLNVVNPRQVDQLTNYLDMRTQELANMANLPYFADDSDDLLRSHLQRMNIDSEVINGASKDELIYLALTNGNNIQNGGGSAYANGTVDTVTRSGTMNKEAWVDGAGLNLNISPIAYGQNSPEQYMNLVLDLSGGGQIKMYGMDPWREQAAKQILLKISNSGDNRMSLNQYLTSIEILANQRNTPYGFLPAMLSNEQLPLHHPLYPWDAATSGTTFDDGLGDIQIDILSRLDQRTLEDLVSLVDPKMRGELPSFPRPNDELSIPVGDDLVDPYHNFYYNKNIEDSPLEFVDWKLAEASKGLDAVEENAELLGGRFRSEGALEPSAHGTDAGYLDPFQASTSAVKETLAIMQSPRFARLFNGRGIDAPLFKQVLEFVGWRELVSKANPRILENIGYTTDSGIDVQRLLMPGDSLEKQINKFFFETNPIFNPQNYAVQQAIANRGAARHADTLFNGAYGRIQQAKETSAGVYNWQDVNKGAVTRGGKGGSPEEDLISRIFDEYHLSLAADGYGATARHSSVDEVPWSGYKEGLLPGRLDGTVSNQPVPNKFSPVNKGNLRVTSTNPLILRSPTQIGRITGASTLDDVFQGGVVDAASYIDFFESQAKAVLDRVPPAITAEKNMLETAIQAQQNGFRNYKQISDQFASVVDRIVAIQKDFTTLGKRSQYMDDLLQHTKDKIARLDQAFKQLDDFQANFSNSLDSSAGESRAGLNRMQKDIEEMDNTLRQLAIGDMNELNEFLSVSESATYGEAMEQLNKAASVIEFKGGYPKVKSVEKRIVRRDMGNISEQTMLAGMMPVGTRSQASEDIVSSILDWNNYQAYGKNNPILKAYDATHNLIKGYLLQSPGFFARNFYGGVFMNYMAGVSPAKYKMFMEAAIVLKARTVDPETVAGKQIIRVASKYNVPEEHISYIKMLQDEGAFGAGQSAIEFETTQGAVAQVAGKKIKFSTVNPFNRNNVALSVAKKFNVKVENVLRGTIGLDRMIATQGDLGIAFDDIYKYHFDYEDLSKFEAGAVKRVSSFYTWTRKALPLMMQSVATQPKVWNNYQKLIRGISSDKEADWQKMPAWQRRSGYVPVRGTDGNWTSNIDLPPKALLEFGSQLAEGEGLGGQGKAVFNFMMANTNPMLKGVIEGYSKNNFWKDYQFNGTPQPVSRYFSKIPGLMKALQAANYGGLHYDSGTDKWYMDDNSYHALQQFAPPLNTLRRLVPDEKSKQDNLITAYVSFFTGTGFRQITEGNVESEKVSRFFEQKNQEDRQQDLKKAIAKEQLRQGQ
tara:strand:+ start:812 stop:10117 length:9306 start_codon:yes stop_codon:yes gene_type:complete